jgi:DNA-binding FadR family transcriptional regulator
VPLQTQTSGEAATSAQTEFFHTANAAAVQGVLDAIETQVDRLLPEGISKSARNRVVGEIYRELDTTLRSNRQLGHQMRDAFRSGALDGDHQRAVVSLITGRARQALPGVAKRVLSEWTSTVVAANQDRRDRQRTAERRVDIAGTSGGGESGRSASPREIDYRRMSDSDILNL